MKKLNKVTGRITKPGQIKMGNTYFSSGTGGVEKFVAMSVPKSRCGTMWVDTLIYVDWQDRSTLLDNTSLGDMGVQGYGNKFNRLFRKEKQAKNWQVYLEVSEGFKAHEEAMMDFHTEYLYEEGDY